MQFKELLKLLLRRQKGSIIHLLSYRKDRNVNIVKLSSELVLDGQ